MGPKGRYCYLSARARSFSPLQTAYANWLGVRYYGLRGKRERIFLPLEIVEDKLICRLALDVQNILKGQCHAIFNQISRKFKMIVIIYLTSFLVQYLYFSQLHAVLNYAKNMMRF